MKKYRSNTYEVKARRWYLDSPHPKVQQSPYHNTNKKLVWLVMDDKGKPQPLHWNEGWIETTDGGMVVNEGDYIVENNKGEYYVLRPNLFNYRFKKVEE